MKQIDLHFFPNWTRKSISFSIDDGNVPMDEKFLQIMRPAGIKGTFNVCAHSLNQLSPEEYRAFYAGYEIANHVKYHPFAFADGQQYTITDEAFDPQTADPKLVYPAEVPHLYHIMAPRGWRMIADTEGYLTFAEEGRKEAEAVFGEGSVRSFVWPFHQQENKELIAGLRQCGYYGLRNSGSTGSFAMPEDRMDWSYTANHEDILESAAKYEALPDDGTLHFFCIGVHSVDYENAGKWDDLAAFAQKYGKRPETYFYGTVGEIFACEDAVKAAKVTEQGIENPSDLPLYAMVDGKKIVIPAGETCRF